MLPAVNLLASVVASLFCAPSGALCRLRVGYPGAGVRVPAQACPQVLAQHRVELYEASPTSSASASASAMTSPTASASAMSTSASASASPTSSASATMSASPTATASATALPDTGGTPLITLLSAAVLVLLGSSAIGAIALIRRTS